MITGFVFIMMLVIEYVNVWSQGIWQNHLTGNKWRQYLVAGILGAIPGCLGAFTVVALFSHRLVSFGALVTAMIATSGDEAFVMFAMFPKQAAFLTAIIFAIGMLAGFLTDKSIASTGIVRKFSEKNLPLHDAPKCKCFMKDKIWGHLFHPTKYRFVLTIMVLLLILGVSTGMLAKDTKIWTKTTILLSLGFSLFVVASVPEHFLKQHIWEHIVKEHILRIFLWTLGSLLAIHFLMNYIHIQAWLSDNMLVVLFVAIVIGIIPESGPHLIFVTLFFEGAIPFSVLLASSISQDGHGSLPLLAESKRGFLTVKLMNIIYALIFGLIGYFTGF